MHESVCVYMCAYISVFMHKCMSIHIFHMHAYIHVCMYAYKYTEVYRHTYSCVHSYLFL